MDQQKEQNVNPQSVKLCSGGGCSAKIGPGILKSVLEKIPKFSDDHLLVGFESSDDAAVYQLTDEIAVVQTLDFFPPIVEDPYIFGKIAAANALSDIYAMGAQVKLALNIVCFSEKMDPDILGEIMRGGAEKVKEAGGVLCGGHSVNDNEVKYGLSVTGIVHPGKILANNRCNIGDKLILTKPLGVGLIMAAHKMGEASDEAYQKAMESMQTLNKYAAEIMLGYRVSACTDVTGFGFLGHLNEMVGENYSAVIFSENIPYIPQARQYAKEFFITAAAQKNRNHVGRQVAFGEGVDFSMQEVLFDPQTSGGLLISVNAQDAQALQNDLNALAMQSGIVGEITQAKTQKIRIV